MNVWKDEIPAEVFTKHLLHLLRMAVVMTVKIY